MYLKKTNLKSGFTLAELALVILILGVLLTVIFSVMTGIFSITTHVSPYKEIKRDGTIALQGLKSSLDQAYYIPGIQRLFFKGIKDGYEGARKDKLYFASVLSGAEETGVSAVREVTFYLKPNLKNNTFNLMRREVEVVDNEPTKGGNHYLVIENINSLSFRYQTETKDWVDNWDTREKNRLPGLIEIELIIKLGLKEYKFKTISQPGLTIK